MRLPTLYAPWAKHIGYRLWLLTEPVISFWHMRRGSKGSLAEILGAPVRTRPHGADLDGFVFPRMGSYVVSTLRCAKLAVVIRDLAALSEDDERPTLYDEHSGLDAVYLGAMTVNKQVRIFIRVPDGDEGVLV